jgi:hypothetical protein
MSRTMSPLLVLVHHEEKSETEQNLCGIAGILGIETVLVRVGPLGVTADPLPHQLQAATALAISASAFCAVETLGLISGDLSELTRGAAKNILLYGFQSNRAHADLVARLTGAAVRAITAIPNATRSSFPRDGGPLVGPLSGCDFEREPAPLDVGFELEAGTGVQRILEVGHTPVFIRLERAGNPLFLWAHADPIPGPETPIAEADLVRRCDRFVPALVFLRSAFDGHCWENPIKTARVIIDDPLLKRRYGFIRYEELFRSMRRLGCGVTTAFIPWNWQRTTRRDARLFAPFLPDHSLCVHGCDHTGNEFGEGSEYQLAAKALAALERMDNHRDRTALGSSRVMVFPQGKFSTVAMRALRRAGFLAVVNTTRVPVDCPGDAVTLAQELQPAVTCYSGLPLFKRRYPADLQACALDLFLGRPAHIVEHHGWFRHGCGDFERCVEWLKAVQPGLSWPSLEVALPRQHLRRMSTGGGIEIQFFTPQFSFENPLDQAASYVFSKPEPDPSLVGSVTVDGNPVACDRVDGVVRFCFRLQPRQSMAVAVNVANCPEGVRWSPPFKYRVRVGLRRALSEMRDNHLARHPGAFRAAKAITGALRARSR